MPIQMSSYLHEVYFICFVNSSDENEAQHVSMVNCWYLWKEPVV